MALDQTANFVRVNVEGTHTSTDTTIQLETGEASEVPDPANGEYNLVWWNDTQAERPSADPNVEIVRVTGVDTGNDTLTVLRGQEGTSAVAHDSTGDDYRMILGATSKMFSDINDVTNLSGSAGTAGQLLQTDGTNLSFADVTGGMTDKERQAFNDLVAQMARNDFADNLSEMAYDGGLYDIFRDTSKIATQTNVTVSTLAGGDPDGKVELAEDVTGYQLSSATYTGTSISTQDVNPSGIAFNSDGTKMFEIGDGSALIYEYSLSTAYDISTATFQNSISSQDAAPTDITFNDTGSKMFEVGDDSNLIYEYSLSTAYDISTATFQNSISTQDGIPRDIAFNDTGSKMFEIGFSSALIYEYSLSTAYDISTASYTGTSISTQDGFPTGIAFNSDGTKMFEVGYASNSIYESSLSTAYDISTATFQNSISAQDSIARGITFNSDGTKMFEIGQGSDMIYEYDSGSSAGFFSSGSFTTVSVDLSTDANGGFTSPPASWVLSQDADLPTSTDIQYVLRDGNGNTVTATQSDVDTEVDTSNLTSPNIEIDGELSTTDSSVTPSLFDHSHHFQQ